METWRQHNFRKGYSYRVKVSFSTATSQFCEGEKVTFIDSSYSPYDANSGFMFRDESSDQVKTWFLSDSEEDRSSDLFDLI